MTSCDISMGAVVESLSGRDAGRLFLVLNREGNYLSLADGKLRKIERPKKKKIRHVRLFAACSPAFRDGMANGAPVTNREIRKELNRVREIHGNLTGGDNFGER